MLEKLNFAENVLLSKGGFFLYSFSAKDISNADVWCVIAISKDNNEKFIKDVNEVGKTVNLEDYGNIIKSGYGTKPDDVTLEKIKEEFSA
jgi:hypothetical protein